jgi:hypothetical protein
MFQDAIGGQRPDDILKSIDKDLGRAMVERSGASSPSLNLERELRSPSDKFK